jgi:murein DD-endopeptidase MepM/ murein hydrolase activator NlpD
MAQIYQSQGPRVNLSGPQQGVGFQPVQAFDPSQQIESNAMRRAQQLADFGDAVLRNQSRDVEILSRFSTTLNEFLFKQAEQHNENEMKLGLASVLNGDLRPKDDVMIKFKQQETELATQATTEAQLSDTVAQVSPAVAEQRRQDSPALTGWRAYGAAIGRAKMAAASAQTILQDFMESDQPVVPIPQPDGTVKLIAPNQAKLPAEINASIAVGQQMFIDQSGISNLNPLVLAEHLTPTMLAVKQAIVSNRVAAAREEFKSEAIENVQTRIGADVAVIDPSDASQVQKVWQESTRELQINGRLKRGEANKAVIEAIIDHTKALGRSDILEAFANTPLIAEQPNGPTVGDRFRPLFEEAGRSIDQYQEYLQQKAEKDQDDQVSEVISAHQLLLTQPGVTQQQIKESYQATAQQLRTLSAAGNAKAVNALSDLLRTGENYNPYLAADLSRDIASGIRMDPASIDELVRRGRISASEANDLKSQLPSSATLDKMKVLDPEIKRLVKGIYQVQLSEAGITPLDAGSAVALLEGQMSDELSELAQTYIEANPKASPAELRDFLRTRAEAISKQPRFTFSIDQNGRVKPNAPLSTNPKVNKFLNPVTGKQTLDFTSVTPAQVQTARPKTSVDFLISSRDLATNTQNYLNGAGPTPRAKAMMIATGRSFEQLLRDQSKAYGIPFTNLTQSQAAKAAQIRRQLAPAAAAILDNPNATPSQRIRSWNDINAAKQRQLSREQLQPGGTSGPINFQAAYNALVGKESGGDASVLNRDGSGAVGLGQVMPENVGPWTQKWLGRAMTPEEFRRNPEAQRRVVSAQFQMNINDQLAAGNPPDIALRKAASIWYSGKPELYDDPRPQYWNGRKYPSVKQYTEDVLRRYQQNFSSARFGGRANFTPQNVQSIRIENPADRSFQPGMDLWFADKKFGAVLPGVVKEVRRNWGNYGNMIIVESTDPQTGDKIDVLYSHLDRIDVAEGQPINVGSIIGKQGGTGRVESEDKTIASIDFLSPAPKGSNSMTPYRKWKQLAERIKSRIELGKF